jgi:hypothetical protein
MWSQFPNTNPINPDLPLAAAYSVNALLATKLDDKFQALTDKLHQITLQHGLVR